LLAGLAAQGAAAQSALDRQEQLRRAQRLDQRIETQQNAPFQALPQAAAAPADGALPKETPCFALHTLRLEGERAEDFGWVQRYLDRYRGQCVGRAGLALLQKRVASLILARGYITTRVGIPAQDIAKGQLRLLLVPGVIRRIRFAEGSPASDWHTAFPIGEGDLLNLRALEQGLEQFKRLSSQDVSMDIAPGEQAGESDVVLTVHRTRRWHVALNASDAGLRATGRDQGGADLTVDDPLGWNDQLTVGLNGALRTHDDGGSTQGNHFSYSVPRGWWTFSGSYSFYKYRQWVDGFMQRFRSTGTSKTGDLSIQRVIARGTTSRTALEFHLATRNAHSFLQGVEVGVQRQRTASVELALLHRQYFGRAQLDARLGYQRGVPWFGSQWFGYDPNVGYPTNRYGLQTLDLALSLPFAVGRQPVAWDSSLHAQRSTDHLPSAELVTIGGRYTVRGFDGEETLLGERGAYWRNTFTLPIAGAGIAPYLGVDAGRVGGPSTQQGRRWLAGGFVGLRGSYRPFSWDAFAGWALHTPRALQSKRPATGVQLIYQF
jgi:hemolysin activation/secretion protein